MKPDRYRRILFAIAILCLTATGTLSCSHADTQSTTPPEGKDFFKQQRTNDVLYWNGDYGAYYLLSRSPLAAFDGYERLFPFGNIWYSCTPGGRSSGREKNYEIDWELKDGRLSLIAVSPDDRDYPLQDASRKLEGLTGRKFAADPSIRDTMTFGGSPGRMPADWFCGTLFAKHPDWGRDYTQWKVLPFLRLTFDRGELKSVEEVIPDPVADSSGLYAHVRSEPGETPAADWAGSAEIGIRLTRTPENLLLAELKRPSRGMRYTPAAARIFRAAGPCEIPDPAMQGRMLPATRYVPRSGDSPFRFDLAADGSGRLRLVLDGQAYSCRLCEQSIRTWSGVVSGASTGERPARCSAMLVTAIRRYARDGRRLSEKADTLRSRDGGNFFGAGL